MLRVCLVRVLFLTAFASIQAWPATANDKETLDALLADYKAYGLPMPPTDAKLVRVKARWLSDNKPEYLLGFLLQPANGSEKGIALVGTRRYEFDGEFEIVADDPDPEVLSRVARQIVFSEAISVRLPTAIQLHARGWDRIATAGLHAVVTKDLDVPDGVSTQSLDSPQSLLAFIAWTHWYQELTKPDSDWPAIRENLELLLTKEPKLDDEYSRALLESLRAALTPSKAKPGSIEALVDDLINVNAPAGSLIQGDPDPRYLRVLERGFDAVPVLIDHFDDQRLTRSKMTGFNNFRAYPRRVREIVSDLLNGIGGDELRLNWLDRQRGGRLTKAAARRWWRRAKDTGEEAYLLANALPKRRPPTVQQQEEDAQEVAEADEEASTVVGGNVAWADDDQEQGEPEWPNRDVLYVIAKKYPQRIADVYCDLQENRPKMQSWPVAEAVLLSSLPEVDKKELFANAARHANLEIRATALRQLSKVDHEKFDELLAKTLDELGNKTVGSYFDAPESHFAHLAMLTESKQVWDALLDAARRAEPGLRMQYLDMLTWVKPDEPQRYVRCRFLSHFLDDESRPDPAEDPQEFAELPANSMFRRKVWERASAEIAYLLELSDEVDEHWSPAQWEALRTRVRQAVAELKPVVPEHHNE